MLTGFVALYLIRRLFVFVKPSRSKRDLKGFGSKYGAPCCPLRPNRLL
jgi:hypothetical protein